MFARQTLMLRQELRQLRVFSMGCHSKSPRVGRPDRFKRSLVKVGQECSKRSLVKVGRPPRPWWAARGVSE